jgi:dienelactone hydrolase
MSFAVSLLALALAVPRSAAQPGAAARPGSTAPPSAAARPGSTAPPSTAAQPGAATAAAAPSVARIEVIPIASVTLDGAQFLRGDKDGKPAQIAGELRIPSAPGKLPAVVLIHGSGGLSSGADRWASELIGLGVAVFLVDSFSGRGIVNTVADQSQLSTLAMMADAYRALAILAEHPRIDPSRIAVMGFSKGAVAAVYSAVERFHRMYGGSAAFAAHIGLYTPCNVTYRDDTKVSKKPIRLFHGIADDYVAIGACRGYVERLKKAGADVALTEYPDALHAYDNPGLPPALKVPQGQTTRNCTLREGERGEILNARTGKSFDLHDPCVELGPQVGYNAAAHTATVKAVKALLTTTFALGK